MSKSVSICQPTYLPWLGYFELIEKADTFVFLDHVQFEKQSWQCRNRLKGSNSAPFWITIPLEAHESKTPINEIYLAKNKSNWARKHLQSIRMALSRAPFFDEIFPHLEEWLSSPHDRLADLTIDGISRFCKLLDIGTPLIRSSTMDVDGCRSPLVIGILKNLDATCYRANQGSKAYMTLDAHLFEAAGISCEYQDWEHPQYKQNQGEFISHLAFPDALCHLGLDEVKSILKD